MEDQEQIEEIVSKPKEETKEALSDKELNFARLRDQKKRVEMEREELRKKNEELLQAIERERSELEALKARQKEMALEASLFADEEDEDPSEIVSLGKFKEKQKKLAARQAHILAKQEEAISKKIKAQMQEELEKTKREVFQQFVAQEAHSLLEQYGEEGIEKELSENKHLKTVIDLLPTEKRAAYLKEHFREKEKAKKLLEGSNRGSGSVPNTGIGSGIMDRGDQLNIPQSINTKDLFDPAKAQQFHNMVVKSLKIPQRR